MFWRTLRAWVCLMYWTFFHFSFVSSLVSPLWQECSTIFETESQYSQHLSKQKHKEVDREYFKKGFRLLMMCCKIVPYLRYVCDIFPQMLKKCFREGMHCSSLISHIFVYWHTWCDHFPLFFFIFFFLAVRADGYDQTGTVFSSCKNMLQHLVINKNTENCVGKNAWM